MLRKSYPSNRSFRGIAAEAMQLLVNAHWPGNVRQLRNLVEWMVVLAPGHEIRASDIPNDVRESGTRLLPMRLRGPKTEVAGRDLEFIFRSLVELKLQIEELRRRMDDQPQQVEVIEVGGGLPYRTIEHHAAIDLTEDQPEPDRTVLYEAGMSMADVERAAIEGALTETHGNRRRAAQQLGIGERTLYRKIKEYGLG